VSRPTKLSFNSYEQVKLKFNIFSNICQGFLVTKSQKKDKLLDNSLFFITLCCLTFLVLILINLYKSIKHPRRISSHPSPIQHPTWPFDLSPPLSGLLSTKISLLSLLSGLPPSATLHLRLPLSLTSLPLLRRGRFFITLGWFISRRDIKKSLAFWGDFFIILVLFHRQ